MPILPQQIASQVKSQVAQLLDEFEPDPHESLATPVQQAIHVARLLQRRAADLQTSAERRQQAELTRMMEHPGDKATLTQLTDQAFRSSRWDRAADQLIHVLDVQGVPRFFSMLDRTLMRGFQTFGDYLPGVTMPLVKEKMRQETATVVLPAEPELLKEHLQARREQGLRMNVNHLGEALLGEREARRRIDGYLAMLQRPEIEVISVKISTIYSQISPLARDHTIGVLSDRLELLYRAAAKATFTRSDGSVVPKFVYLDMEEYRDMHLTAEAFMRTLNLPGLQDVRAGIVLQAYIPDSFPMQQQINAWARERVNKGGAPITMRIVKGANMEMERVEASLAGWPQAPYRNKIETDANYKRMLQEGLKAENLPAVRLGIASHNLFTLAYGLVAAYHAEALPLVQFEMLEGMANHQRRALCELSKNLLLYAPTCHQEDFVHAIGYLVRRLDENTGPDNFLRHAFNIEVDSETWRRLERHFADSFAAIETVSHQPRRTQNRRNPPPPRGEGDLQMKGGEGADSPQAAVSDVPKDPAPQQTLSKRQDNRHPTPSTRGQEKPRSPQSDFAFTNEPDTDWALPHHSQWANSIIERWQPRYGDAAAQVPVVIAGQERQQELASESTDPSRPEVVVAKYHQATPEELAEAIKSAEQDSSAWRKRPVAERRLFLNQVADEIATRRDDLLGAMMAEAGKLFPQSDPEVSEAIDFCRFYGESAEHWQTQSQLTASGRGVVVVVSPWNFPLAIPCGGVAAALAAGNSVILKPASDTVLTAYMLCECFWNTGVPREALQFAPTSGRIAGEHLITHPAVDAVILTGGTETARNMLQAKPDLRLFAETGGKNATIVTAMADRDLAIKNVLASAFGHSGQKCSATSLLILEQEVYEDGGFRDALADAAQSLHVGSAWELPTKVGPLIRPPSGELEQGLKELESGESWLVLPELHVNDNPSLISPGIKWGVSPGSFTHQTEFFGPLLAVMPARNLEEAISMVNATGYGLTSGLESLDDREHEVWQRSIHAGNLYINRPTTGAIVLRQPFGGIGKSNVGPGLKAGGPNYVAQLMQFRDDEENSADAIQQPAIEDALLADLVTQLQASRSELSLSHKELDEMIAAIADYELAAREEFRNEHDHFRLLGEDNHRRYVPVSSLRVRVSPEDSLPDVIQRIAAARVAGCRVTVSHTDNLPPATMAWIEWLDRGTDLWAAAIEFIQESDSALAHALAKRQAGRLRYASPVRVPEIVRQAAAESLVYVADVPPNSCGHLELLWYLREQTITKVYHRYGNLGARGIQQRHTPA